MLLAKTIGTNGRLGNQLFQIAFLYYTSKRLGVDYAIPYWPYQDYFQHKHPVDTGYDVDHKIQTKEPHVSLNVIDEIEKHIDSNIDIEGFFQSSLYFDDDRIFLYDPDKLKEVKSKISQLFNRTVVGVHIRKGDYVTNGNYVNLSPEYYLSIINKYYPDPTRYVLLIFTDDYKYSHAALSHLPHTVFFAKHYNDIESMMALSMCNEMILANSTFSWWAYQLALDNFGKPKRCFVPSKMYEGRLSKYENNDFWPMEVKKMNYQKPYYDLSDVTFIIPVQRDSKDREENLNLTLKYIKSYFKTNVILGEISNYGFFKKTKDVKYIQYTGYKCFHRTKILNEMTKVSDTPIVINWDADILIPPHQVFDAVEHIRKHGGVGYPYDGRFVRMDRKKWMPLFNGCINLIEGMEGQRVLARTDMDMDQSYGGAFIFDKKDYGSIGYENENFISHAPEDKERYYRSMKLGLGVYRSNGCLYHIDHFMGENSLGKHRHSFVDSNREEMRRIIDMSKDELFDYVRGWPWKTI